MENILHDMGDSLVRYAMVISQVIKIAVTIVDDRQIRIIYNGEKWKYRIGVSMGEKGHIARATIQSGTPQVMLELHGHPGCQQCKERDGCKELAEVWTPILLGGKCLGAIGFICENKQQQQHLKKELETYLTFLQQIADLIASEASQHLESKRRNAVVGLLETVVERLDSGILMLGEQGEVLRVNRAGRRILRDVFELESATLQVEETGEHIDFQTEYILSCQDQKLVVAGNFHEVDAHPIHRVLIFNDVEQMKNRILKGSSFKQIAGTSDEIEEVRRRIKSAAVSPSNVLIRAEGGLGKGMYARAIHDEGERRDKPFVNIDCTALPDQDAEKYLFGVTTLSNVAGARGKLGRIEAASGGTLFLDNIEALPMYIQRRLVQLLEKKEIVRSGSKRPRKVNVRVIASTDQDLSAICEAGMFSRELYYALSVIPIIIPPLRERREDIRPLAVSFIQYFSRELDKPVLEIQDDFWQSVEHYHWPGNARELRSAMEYVVNMMNYPNVISALMLPKQIHLKGPALKLAPMELNLEEVERTVVQRAVQMQKERGLTNEETAQMLGIGIATFYRKIKKYDVNKDL